MHGNHVAFAWLAHVNSYRLQACACIATPIQVCRHVVEISEVPQVLRTSGSHIIRFELPSASAVNTLPVFTVVDGSYVTMTLERGRPV